MSSPNETKGDLKSPISRTSEHRPGDTKGDKEKSIDNLVGYPPLQTVQLPTFLSL